MTALIGDKRDYRAVSYALVSAVGGVIFMRILLYVLPAFPSGYGGALAQTAVFTITTQLVFFLALPFIIYKFYGKRTVRETLDFSSCRRSFKPSFLLALPLGFCVYVLTLGVSLVWSLLLDLTGFNVYSSSTPMPETMSAGFFIAEILLTAVIPAVCEEFIMRGGLLTTLRRSLGTVGCVIVCGVAFGLFHQNIRQVFYTSLFGALAVFLTLRLKSIYPAMILHFTNNFLSVFFEYAGEYGFFGGSLYARIIGLGNGKIWAVLIIFVAVALAAAAIVLLMLYFREKRVIDRKKEVIKNAAFDATKKRVVLFGDYDEKKIADLEMEKEVYGNDYVESKYKPSARDIMILVAVGVTMLLTTVFSYVWGFFY